MRKLAPTASVLVLLLACSASNDDGSAAGSDTAPIGVGPAATSGPGGIRILAGVPSNATPYTDQAGDTWVADADYDVGATIQNHDAIAGTADPTLFHGERWASRTVSPNGFTYTFRNLAPGPHAVTLGFAETSVNPIRAAGQRQFDIYINGARVVANLDIFAEVGLDRALDKTFTADSQNGEIVIRFAPGAAENPKVNALSVVPVSTRYVSAQFFGIHLNKYGTGLKHGSQRLWDAGVGWWALQTGEKTFDFRELRKRVAETPPGVDLMYTLGHTPSSIARKGFTCAHGPGDCNPPSDVGTTDDYVKAFWNAFFHESGVCTGTAPHMTCGPITRFEMWNEANTDGFWSGTAAELARMSADSTEIIKQNCSSCVVLTSNVSCGGDGGHANGETGRCDLWMASYLAAWQKLGHMPDEGAWHPYPSRTSVIPSPFPETNISTFSACHADKVPNSSCRFSIVDQVGVMRSVFDQHGLAGRPMVATEGGFSYDTDLPDHGLQAAFLARWYILQASMGVDRAYWYAQDNQIWGTLVDCGGVPETCSLNRSGRAYNRVYDWLVGARIGKCHTTGTTWSCPVVRKDGTSAALVWDTALTCTGGSCATRKENVGARYTHAEHLDGGAAIAFSGGTLDLSALPVLVY